MARPHEETDSKRARADSDASLSSPDNRDELDDMLYPELPILENNVDPETLDAIYDQVPLLRSLTQYDVSNRRLSIRPSRTQPRTQASSSGKAPQTLDTERNQMVVFLYQEVKKLMEREHIAILTADQAQETVKELEEQVQRLNQTVADLRLGALLATRSTPEPEGEGSNKSYPDPKKKFNGDRKHWPIFKREIRNKFYHSARYYRTDRAKIDYLLQFLEDTPYQLIEARWKEPDGPNSWESYDAALAYLDSHYKDTYEQETAQSELAALTQQANESFSIFHAKWLELISRSGKIAADEKLALKNKLNFLYQSKIIGYSWRSVSYSEFVEHLREIEHDIDRLKITHPPPKRNATASASGTASRSNTRASPAPTSPAAASAASNPSSRPRLAKLTDEERERCMKNGLCFACRQAGHRAGDPECIFGNLNRRTPSHRTQTPSANQASVENEQVDTNEHNSGLENGQSLT